MSSSRLLHHDLFVTALNKESRGTLLLSRSDVLSPSFQLCFALSSKNWREQRSVYAALTSVTLLKERGSFEIGTSFQASCSCHEYRMSMKCDHLEAVMFNTSNKFRIETIAKLNDTDSDTFRQFDEWDPLRIPPHRKDDVFVSHILLRRALSSRFRTSSVVLVDSRNSSIRKSLIRRLQCAWCSGRAGNRMASEYESKVINAITKITANHTDTVQQPNSRGSRIK